ncbi:MAG: flagellar motor switch protein FliN [Bacteroidetes bacterium]|nr:flagellar motor switch protein FliN [Bacteroidota bacterium]MCL5738248.1 flagellar motor switch protein FliN [Bacteroidota bacterium]
MAEDTTQNAEVEKAVQKEVQEPAFEDLTETDSKPIGKDNKLDILLDLNLSVSVELGKTTMMIKDILELGRGSIIEFDKLVSEPVDILVNGRKMAEGEVVVVDKHFGIRITSMVDPSERLKGLKK